MKRRVDMGERRRARALDPDVVPDGFEPFTVSPFAIAAGPLYVNRGGPVPIMGVFLDRQHANSAGFGHGGLLLTVADIALGQAVKAALPGIAPAVTMDVHAMFMVATRLGEWLEARPTIDRVGRSTAYATCTVSRGAETVARVSATFFVRRPDESLEAVSP